jgi:hypothetical protein
MERKLHPDTFMPRKIYREHILASRAKLDSARRAWFVRVSIMRQSEEGIETLTLQPAKLFATEEEAIDEGFRFAELWVDQL